MHFAINMQTRSKSCRIGRRADNQGPRPSVWNQAEVEKSATGTDFSQSLDSHQNRDQPNPELPRTTTQVSRKKITRTKWTREEYKEVLFAFYCALNEPSGRNITEATFNIWKRHSKNPREYLDCNKLANVRRDILKNNRLTDAEKEVIKNKALFEVQSNGREMDDSQNLTVTDVSDNQRDETTDHCKREDIREVLNNVENQNQEEANGNGNCDLNFIEQNETVIGQMRSDILREYTKIRNIEMKDRQSLVKVKSNKQALKQIKIANYAMKEILEELEPDLTELNQLIYATACVVNPKTNNNSKPKTNKCKKPKWKEKIEREIEYFRGEISILEELSKGVAVKTRNARKVIRKYKLSPEQTKIPEITETLKQKIQLKAHRIRRYEKRTKFFRQNKLFKDDPKRLYREIDKQTIEVNDIPSENEIKNFWSSIWSNDKGFNADAEWINKVAEKYKNIETQSWDDITVEELENALKKSQKWKSPGIDKVPNFWLSHMSAMHKLLAKQMSEIISEPDLTPKWLAEGITYLLAKTPETTNAKNFRPITCLSTTYKILTSVLTDRMYTFMEANKLFPLEQKGCKRGSYGCKDQLLINRMLMENCQKNHRNLSMAWIDYRKAFDSVPHGWILRALDIFKLSPTIINFLQHNMRLWTTNLRLTHANGTAKTDSLRIKCGIFQGDSLSPLLFCISLIPLSIELNNAGYGYQIMGKSINHLFYMDDLKLFARNDSELTGLLDTVKHFSDDIGMQFGLDKCAKATFTKGKIVKAENIILDVSTTIKELEHEGMYKYLGIQEAEGVANAANKEKVRKEFYRRVRAILQTELNARNKIMAINSLAIPIVTYGFNILYWTMPEIKRLDVKVRKLLTINKMHHPKADVDRLYIRRSDGGKGLLQLELMYKPTAIGLQTYLDSTEDWMLQLVNRHEKTKKVHSVSCQSRKFECELELSPIDTNETQPTKLAKIAKQEAKRKGLVAIKSKWEQKPLHGQYALRSKDADIDQLNTHQWLRCAGLKAETEGFIMAAQDQSLFTRNYQANIIRNGTDPRCRLCEDKVETIVHLVAGCLILAPKEYKDRHDKLGQYLHWRICQHYNASHAEHWYEHHPEPVTKGNDATILWDFTIHTDRSIKANRPDIIVKDHKEKTCLLIDMTVPSDRNLSLKEYEKVSKYKDLEIEIQKMWNLKVTIVPVVIGALGMIQKKTEGHIKRIPGNPCLQELQKIVLNGTAHLLRRVLSI